MVWSSASKKKVRKLQLVQNYACRIAAGLRKYDHISEALKSLKWLNVKDKLLFNDFVMVYKCMNNLTPVIFVNDFNTVQIFTKGTPGKIMTPRCPSVGLRLAKGLLPSVEQKFKIIYQSISETRKVLAFLKRDFLKIFLIHRFFIVVM